MHYFTEENERDGKTIFYLGDEYFDVFKTIPPIFKYVVNILKENPEVLEQNDISTFTEDKIYMIDNDETMLESEDGSCCDNADSSFNSGVTNNVKNIMKITKFIAPIRSMFYFTPEEVMEQILIVEQELDEYNRKKQSDV